MHVAILHAELAELAIVRTAQSLFASFCAVTLPGVRLTRHSASVGINNSAIANDILQSQITRKCYNSRLI